MLTKAWFPLRHHEQQYAAWRTGCRRVCIAAGRGSGKTEIARRRVVLYLQKRKPWDDPIYFYALPTFAQAKRVAWKKLKNLVPTRWVSKISESELTIETKFGSTLYLLGMDKPERAEGVQWDGGVIDESSDQKPGTFDTTLLPALSHRDPWVWRIGVPKRYGIGAADFKQFYDKGLMPNSGVETYHWKSDTVLSEEQLQWARDNLDPRDYAEQYEASWEQAGGLIFHAFDEVLNVRETMYEPALPLLIGCDFNVDPMAWVVGHEKDGELHIIDELWERDTNTERSLEILAKRYGDHPSAVAFCGDAAGRARKTSASESDYLQIVNTDRFINQPQVFFPDANPRVVDRFASTNAMICNASKVRRCFINPRCKHLIADLKIRSFKQGTREPNDSGDIGHITDALGYLIFEFWPIVLNAVETSGEIYSTRK